MLWIQWHCAKINNSFGDDMNYTLNIGVWNSVFAVPSSVVDKYIKLASGNSLKLLLFLLRHGGETYSAERLKTELGFFEYGELEDAALFWVQRNIISFSNGEDGWLEAAKESSDVLKNVPAAESGILDFADNSESSKQVTTENETNAVSQLSDIVSLPKQSKISPISVSSGEIARRIREDSSVKALYDEAEKLYGKPLTQRDNQTIISLVDHFGLPVAVAMMLLQYCSRVKKLTPHYIQSVAAEWFENGIVTVEAANARIRSMEKQNDFEEHIHEALQMTVALTPGQTKYLRKWSNEWGFSEEMIILAINMTVEQIGNPKFSYANKILESWKNENITTEEQVNNKQRTYSSGKSSGDTHSSSFDMDDVMAMIKNRYNEG